MVKCFWVCCKCFGFLILLLLDWMSMWFKFILILIVWLGWIVVGVISFNLDLIKIEV